MRKTKDWNMERADKEFSMFIRKRDGRCMNPLCPERERDIKKLECSHFYSRSILLTRFDIENCIALCHGCHTSWEHSKNGKYKELVISLIGVERFNAMHKRVDDYKYKMIPHLTKNNAIQKCREFIIKNYEKNI
jgi:hypothetical protein